MPIPSAVAIELTDEERAVLEGWTRRRKSAQALALRARIVLMASEGLWSNGEIAEALGVSRPTVTKWRNRFAQRRFEGLADEPRPGKPRTITDEQVEAVVTKTLESTPKNATHWSTRSMAREMGMTPDAVMRIWHAFGLAPHRQETWKLSKDPLFIEKVHDICGLYLNPPERAVVLCVDEKSQIQALDRTAPTLPMLPGTPERATHDYERHGTSSLYAALNLKSGEVIGSLHQRHRAVEFLKFLKAIDQNVPAHLDVHLVLDNASSHKTPKVRRWLTQHPRFHLHFTPTSSSRAGGLLAVLLGECVRHAQRLRDCMARNVSLTDAGTAAGICGAVLGGVVVRLLLTGRHRTQLCISEPGRYLGDISSASL